MKKPTVAVFTLGCKTNSYESGQIVTALRESGYAVTEGLVPADIFVLNTCAVTAEAESKSRQAVARARKLNPDCKIVVTGCAAEKNAAQFAALQNVTLVRGNAYKSALSGIIGQTETPTEPLEPGENFDYAFSSQSKTRAYIKIQDGCDKFCSYCIVPHLRGRSRSRRPESILREINSSPAKEYVLIGIDISQYGLDIGTDIAELLEELSDVKARIRLGSVYQEAVTEKLLRAMKKNVCRHFHLSLQSGSDNVLRAMNRHYDTAGYYETVRLIRRFYPECGITTDIIVGFPVETDEDFAATAAFVEKVGFSDIHVFPYSPRKGTSAYELGKLEPAVVKKRVEKLIEIKRALKSAFTEKYLGTKAEVLVEEKKGGFYLGYTDNYLRVYIPQKVNIGEFVTVTLAEKYDEGAKGTL